MLSPTADGTSLTFSCSSISSALVRVSALILLSEMLENRYSVVSGPLVKSDRIFLSSTNFFSTRAFHAVIRNQMMLVAAIYALIPA